MNNTVNLPDKFDDQVIEFAQNKIRSIMSDPEVIEALKQRVCEIANSIITSHPEWKKIRKDEDGQTISHRFTDSTNWQVSVDENSLSYEFKNITPPSKSIFNNEKFGRESKYEYDPSKDPFHGAALSVWIDEGLWLDASKIFKEMARSDGHGKIRLDDRSMRRSGIPFLHETYQRVIEDDFIRHTITSVANK